jgi:formate hydrogenlyase transcriptional activator
MGVGAIRSINDKDRKLGIQVVAAKRDVILMKSNRLGTTGSFENEMKSDHSERLKFESMLADMAAIFVNLPIEQVDSHIELALRQIVEFMKFDRATFYQKSNNIHLYDKTHCWARPGFERRLDYDLNETPWLLSYLTRVKKPLKINHPGDLPAEAEQDKIFLKRHNIRSLVIIPLLASGNIVGGVTFGALQVERSFPDDMVKRLLLLSTIFAGALQRRNDELSLKQALKEVRELKDKIEVENRSLQKEIRTLQAHGQIIGQSIDIRKVLQQIKQVAKTDSTVLIMGETGTGKELIAWAIHENSSRKSQNLICVNCAGLPPSIIESELFGREKGAFTGADSRQLGRFETANGSTIFLDEIGELPLDVQAKLLRVLETRRFERLGSNKTIEVNVRVLAATNRDLAKSVKNGTFREDLFYRLNVFPILMPPLRNHPEDISPLVNAYATEFSERFGKNIESVSLKALKALEGYSWPGNVRELRNVVERSVILSQSPILKIKTPESPVSDTVVADFRLTLKELEREHILDALKRTQWRVSGENGAATLLDIKPKTLEARMKKLGIYRSSRNTNILGIS